MINENNENNENNSYYTNFIVKGIMRTYNNIKNGRADVIRVKYQRVAEYIIEITNKTFYFYTEYKDYVREGITDTYLSIIKQYFDAMEFNCFYITEDEFDKEDGVPSMLKLLEDMKKNSPIDYQKVQKILKKGIYNVFEEEGYMDGDILIYEIRNRVCRYSQ